MEVNHFQILLMDVTFYLFNVWKLACNVLRNQLSTKEVVYPPPPLWYFAAISVKSVVNCQNSRDKGPPEGNSARG